jgi:hypothetical protein
MELTTDQWFKLLGLLVTVGVAAAGYFMANKNWQRQIRYDSKIAAYKGAWKLLSYMAFEDNPEKGLFEMHHEGAEQEVKNMYLLEDRVAPFFQAVEEVIYEEGHGIYLPSSFRQKLFKYKHDVGKVFYAEKKQRKRNKENMILLNDSLATYLRRTKQELTEELRQLMKEDRML